MPELPEVETVCRSITPHICGQTVKHVIIRYPRLRWPIPPSLTQILPKKNIQHVSRRAKYLLLQFAHGTLIVHLGMSGRLYICPEQQAIEKHDHFDLVLGNKTCLRLTDPRRFGAVLWSEKTLDHPLLANLGIEPLSREFTGRALFNFTQHRKMPIKSLLMDSSIVVGIGNIYAAEALFLAGVHPLRTANNLSLAECSMLVKSIKQVLKAAIKQGGTTLKDFVNGDNKPGYFKQRLQVYGRDTLPCLHCKTPLQLIRINQRSTVFCQKCQKADSL